MGSNNWTAFNRNQKKEARAFPVFRFKRNSPVEQDGLVLPFTEMPEELKHRHPPLGSLVQKFFNFLFLLILGVALIGLVLAFAYQLIYNPDALQAQASSVVAPTLNFIQGLAAGTQ
jgi:hypothetical protein